MASINVIVHCTRESLLAPLFNAKSIVYNQKSSGKEVVEVQLLLNVILTLQPHSKFNLFIFQEFLDSKGIDNQWMGVRVTSQGPGKNVMVSKILRI